MWIVLGILGVLGAGIALLVWCALKIGSDADDANERMHLDLWG